MDLALADRANQQMIDRLIAVGALCSLPLIAAFRATPRHRFLDRVFVFQRRRERWHEMLTRDPEPRQLRLLYADRALITCLSRSGAGAREVPVSSSSQPSLMAQMLHDLQLRPGLRVLEIGSGTGYNAALVAHLVGPGQVLSVDVDREVLSRAWDHLRGFSDRGIRLEHADGRTGFAAAAPYDRLIVTAATPDLEPAWLDQLAPGGVLVAPLHLAPGLEFVVAGQVTDGVFEGRLRQPAYFMSLRAEGETGGIPSQSFPHPLAPHWSPAPWAGWFRHRHRRRWADFAQALALFGYLHGLEVHEQLLEEGSGYGVCDRLAGCWCWFGPKHWRLSDDTAEFMAEQLWQRFLARGGPRPADYRLRVTIRQSFPVRDDMWCRHGLRCRQYWELDRRPADLTVL